MWRQPGKKILGWQISGHVYARVELPENTFVVDFGSGQDPHPAADVIVDKYLTDNTHRLAGTPLMQELKLALADGTLTGTEKHYPLVIADLCHLPFKDKSVGFAVTRHVLEHVDDLHGALAELSRVAKAGYVEVPNAFSELLFPQGEIHRWRFRVENGTWRATSAKGYESPWGRMMHELFAERRDIQEAWAQSYHEFHICFVWQGEVGVNGTGQGRIIPPE